MCFTEFAAQNLLQVAQNPIPKKACLMPKVAVMVATRVVFFKRGKCYQNECNWHFVYAQICESRAKTLAKTLHAILTLSV